MSKLNIYLEEAEKEKTKKVIYSQIPVNRQNFKKFKYVSKYNEGELKNLSNEELKAQVYHVKDLARGTKGPIRVLNKISLQSIAAEFRDRGIVPRFTMI